METRGNVVGRGGDVQSGENKTTDTSLKDLPSNIINLLDEFGNGVANQQFDFVATGLKNEMVGAKFCDDFKPVSRVEFSTASTLSVLTALLLDDIQYTAFRK